MLATLRVENLMDKEHIRGDLHPNLQVILMLVNGKMPKKMDRVFIRLLMAECRKGFGKIIVLSMLKKL